MNKKATKILTILLAVFLLSGCTKTLRDGKNVVTYNADVLCTDCNFKCDELSNKYNELFSKEEKDLLDDEKEFLNTYESEYNSCTNSCETKCTDAKKNQTGQSLTANILCKPTDTDVVEIYEKYGVDIQSLPDCDNFKLVSEYEGLWASLFVKPLAWVILKTGSLFNNYGLALIIISILIRALLMPLTKKSLMQTDSISKAQPEIDRINKKYENKLDQQSQMQKAQETMMIYQKYKINPLSSCLFVIIQIPLLFAFLEAINRTPAIFEGKFLGLNLGITPVIALKNGEWWYLILTVILALVTYFSMSRNMNANMGNAESAKQMKFMNNFMLIFIVFASFSLSTAICIYWITTNAFTIIQNIIIKRNK
jgi:YidC/Oxa1 family membrane protein insertase